MTSTQFWKCIILLFSRYTEDDDEVETAKPPMVNGFAVPVKDGPIRSTNPGHRLQPMESEEYADSYNPASDGYDMANGEDDASDVGPLIPPPRGFGGTSPHPLSQSVPQVSTNMTVTMLMFIFLFVLFSIKPLSYCESHNHVKISHYSLQTTFYQHFGLAKSMTSNDITLPVFVLPSEQKRKPPEKLKQIIVETMSTSTNLQLCTWTPSSCLCRLHWPVMVIGWWWDDFTNRRYRRLLYFQFNFFCRLFERNFSFWIILILQNGASTGD